MKSTWEPIELELVRDGYLARVSRTMKPGRWRWVAAPVEHVIKWNRNVTEVPFSKGFSGTRERAVEMAESAIEALKREPKEKK
jgi:hypothetical protein